MLPFYWLTHPIGWFHEHIREKVFVEDQVVGAAVLQQGSIVVPGLVGWENPERKMLSLRDFVMRTDRIRIGKCISSVLNQSTSKLTSMKKIATIMIMKLYLTQPFLLPLCSLTSLTILLSSCNMSLVHTSPGHCSCIGIESSSIYSAITMLGLCIHIHPIGSFS